MKPTRCTQFLSIFMSTSVHVSGQLYAHHQENLLYLCDIGIFHSVWVAVWFADQTATHTEWKIPVSHRYSKFSWWWAHNCPETCTEVEINILRSNVYLVSFIWNRLYGIYGQQNIKSRIKLIAFPRQQWLRERAWILRFLYIACDVSLNSIKSLVYKIGFMYIQKQTVTRKECRTTCGTPKILTQRVSYNYYTIFEKKKQHINVLITVNSWIEQSPS